MGVAGRRSGLRIASTMLIFFPLAAFAPTDSPQSNAAIIEGHPVGEPVTAIIEFGEQYLGANSTTLRLQFWESLVGKRHGASCSRQVHRTRPPKPGFDYVLARVRVEFSSRTSPAHDNYNLNETQFTATAPEGREFDAPILDAPPKPHLGGTLRPGDSVEGWLVFLVPQKVSRPLMVFREDVGTVSYRGGGTWFQLYARPIPDEKPRP